MKKIKIGNTVALSWEIFIHEGDEKLPYDLTGKDISIYLVNAFDVVKIEEFVTENNVLSFTWEGSEQRYTGVYQMTLVENEGTDTMITFDECEAFELVRCSCSDDEEEDTIEKVELSSSINMVRVYPIVPVIGPNGNWWVDGNDTGKPSTGMSAYEFAKENGYTGTEEEYKLECASVPALNEESRVATNAAREAAETANNAATTAGTATQKANKAASDATNAAGTANSAAKSANDAAARAENAIEEFGPAIANKADLDNGKILASQLPDYIMGQVMFGGTATYEAEYGSKDWFISPSANYNAKFNQDNDHLALKDMPVDSHEGVYFICENSYNGEADVKANTGDWIISNGREWVKVDNSDAVTSVAGYVGNVSADSLASELADISGANSLARKTDIPKKLSDLEIDIAVGGGSNIYTWLWNGNDAGFISQSEYDAIQNADAVMISFNGDAIYHAEKIGPTLQFHIILLDEIFTYTFEFSENGDSIQWICTITSIKNDNTEITEIKETLDEIVDEEGYLYSNGEKVDMRFTRSLLPVGTSVPANANLNTIPYLRIGKYYCSQNVDAKTVKNCPVNMAFSMEVFNPLGTNVDDETTADYTYRLRVLTPYDTGIHYTQCCRTSGTPGTWTYDSWYVTPRSKFALASSKNDGSAAIGATNKGVYIDINGEIKAMSYTVAKSVPLNAVFTDTKVTSVGNHYAPAEDEAEQITAPEGEVVTGIKRDAAGHVVGVVSAPQTGGGGGGIATEIDPIFSASVAAGITAEDIAEWDSKQDAISDLESIRNGASKGATALQEEAYKGTIEAVDTNESVEDPELEYATTQYVDTAIANAITTVLNTEV